MSVSNVLTVMGLAIAFVVIATSVTMGQPLFAECGVNTGC